MIWDDSTLHHIKYDLTLPLSLTWEREAAGAAAVAASLAILRAVASASR